MASKILDIYGKVLKYNNSSVFIAFDSSTSEPYFHAKQVCELLKYQNIKKALKNNVKKNDVFHLKEIVKNFKILYKNVQGNTKFLNESGFLKLIIKRGDDDFVNDVFNWITDEVLPSIRKFGEYKVTSELKNKINELNKLLNMKDEKIKILEHNMKKIKHVKGGLVYIMRTIIDKLSLDVNEEIFIKFGRSEDMNDRENNYNTCVPNKIQIIKKIYVNDPLTIEKCVIKKMSNYKIKDKKEYFKCSYNQIIDAVNACVYCYENQKINKVPDINIKTNRTNINDVFDTNKSAIVKIIGICDKCDKKTYDCDKSSDCDCDKVSDCDYDSDDSDDSDDGDDNDDSDDNNITNADTDTDIMNNKKKQYGGNNEINYKHEYMMINKKYLELLFDLM